MQIPIGKFGKTRGLHGWIRLHSYTAPMQAICTYQPWLLVSGDTITFSEYQETPDKLHVLLHEVHNLEAARPFVDQTIFIPKSQLPSLDPGTHYWFELEGLTVINLSGKILGEVAFIFEGSQFPLIVVKRDGRPDLLVPHEPEVVQKVDLESQRITVDWDDY